MVRKAKEVKWGPLLYILGLVLVALAGVLGSAAGQLDTVIYYVIFVLGLVVGFLNIQDEEIEKFLLAGLAISFTSTFFVASVSSFPMPGTDALVGMFVALGWFVNPAIIVVALKVVLDVMRD